MGPSHPFVEEPLSPLQAHGKAAVQGAGGLRLAGFPSVG